MVEPPEAPPVDRFEDPPDDPPDPPDPVREADGEAFAPALVPDPGVELVDGEAFPPSAPASAPPETLAAASTCSFSFCGVT